MQSLSNISIPLPCHENWDAMTLAEQGRFCNACSKTVIDFSLMSNDEIIDYMNRNTGKVCGRFRDTQLKPQRTISQKLKVFLYALFSVFLVQVSEEAFAQNIVDTNRVQNSEYFSIYGRVVDEKKEALEFANVQVYEGGILKGAGKTDLNGNYNINQLPKGRNYDLKIFYVGMATQEIKEIPLGSNRKIDIAMEKKLFNKQNIIIGMITRWREPLVDPSNPGQQIMRKEDMKRMPIH